MIRPLKNSTAGCPGCPNNKVINKVVLRVRAPIKKILL
jgi:hypothetical protein